MLLDHAIFNAVWMFSKFTLSKTAVPVARVLFVLMLLHAGFCIGFGIASNKGAKISKANSYTKMNVQTIIQRVGGVLLIMFTVLHVLGAMGVMHMPKAVFVIVYPLFFTLALMHVAISGSKAFITLGIGNYKFIRVIDKVIKLICILTLVADVLGFYLYLV